MSKRLLQFVTAIAVGIGMLFAMSGVSLAEQEGDFTFTVADGKATITGYTGPGGDVVIPATLGGVPVVGIGDQAFYENTAVVRITLPSGIQSIGDHAFSKCINLISISLPDSVVSIANAAFLRCVKLQDISLPPNLTSISSNLFYSCSYLSNITIPSKVQSIGEDAFNGCLIRNIVIPNSVTSIGNNAFRSCGLQALNIPNGMKTIGEYAFYGSSFTSLAIPASVSSIGKGAFSRCSNLSDVSLPSNLTSIVAAMFEGDYRLESITIPNGVDSIEGYAFDGCGLKELTIPSSVRKLGYRFIGQTQDLHTVTIQNGITEIGQGSFGGSYITDIVLPDSVVNIESAFSGCQYLESVTLPSTMVFLSPYAFRNCPNLKTVHFPDTLASIKEGAFINCTALESLVFPGSVGFLSSTAFTGCSGLSSVYFCGSYYLSNSQIFADSADDFLVYYHIRNTQLWAGFTDFPKQAFCKVTYDIQDGSSSGNHVVNTPIVDGKISEPNPPERTGLSFTGWFSDPGCQSPWSFAEDMASDDISLFAGWTGDVAYRYIDNGDIIGSGIAQWNTSLVQPADPVRTGHAFVGWFQDLSFQEMWNFDVDTIKYDLDLYANFIPKTFTVTFSSQGGTAVSPKTAEYNTTITAPTAPTRSGYVFQGWYKEPACTNAWNFSTDKVTADITLYAKWVSTVPAAVKAVSASYTGIKVAWNAVPGASGYQVYSATSSAGPWTLKGTVTTASFTNTGLVTGKYYYYKVRSYNAAKVYSAFSAVTYTKPIPATPYSMRAARASSTSIKITWGAISGATRYEVWRSTSSGGTYTLVGTTSSLYYINSRLTTGRTYYYKVRTYHLEGSTKVYSAWSAVVAAKP